MLRNRPSLFVLENIGIEQDKVHEERSRLSSGNSITSRARLVSLLLDFPFRLFFFHLHPGKCGASQEALPALGPEVAEWERPRYGGGRGGWANYGTNYSPRPARSAGDRDPQTTQFFFSCLLFLFNPVREWGGRGKKLGADCVPAHREGVHHFGGRGCAGRSL